MSIILGISNGIHNSSAALIKDGVIVGAVEEERISRHKRDGRLPIGAVNSLLQHHEPSEISKIAVSGTGGASVTRRVKFRLSHGTYQQKMLNSIIGTYNGLTKPENNLMELSKEIIEETSIESDVQMLRDNIQYVDHHLAHAAGGYFTSGFKKATVISIDSAGDKRSSTVYYGKKGELTEIAANDSIDSIGRIWSRLPTVYGFKGAKHAGKFMGLAAYADEPPEQIKREFQNMISVNGMDIKNKWARDLYGSSYEEHVADLRDKFSDYSAPVVARALQEHTKDIVTDLIQSAIKETDCGNIALSGGVFANVKVNQAIYDLPKVDAIWVQQAMSDSGLSVGSAYYVGSSHYNWKPKRLNSVSVGPEYNDGIKSHIDDINKDNIKNIRNIDDMDKLAQTAATHLSKGDVICLYSGRLEYGPRALGQRSILYQPTDPDAIKWLNQRLNRTEFMPFAPVTLKHFADECYENYNPEKCPAADHMTVSFDCTEKMQNRSPGVVHVDGTARPQIIDKEDNKIYYKILKEYHNKTGIPSLINTSFNMHGEPIVCTPEQALTSWIQSDNEVLIMGDHILTQGD